MSVDASLEKAQSGTVMQGLENECKGSGVAIRGDSWSHQTRDIFKLPSFE